MFKGMNEIRFVEIKAFTALVTYTRYQDSFLDKKWNFIIK